MLYRIGMVMEQVDMVFVGGLNTLCKILAHVFAMGGTHLVAYILLTELLGGGGITMVLISMLVGVSHFKAVLTLP